MPDRIAFTLTPQLLERERPNLERGSVVADGVTGLALGACCEVELLFPTGARVNLPGRAVLATGTGTVFAFDGADREALRRLLAAPAAPPDAPASPPAEADGTDGEGPEPAASALDQLRGLSVVEQLRVAREGTLAERVALERLYGKTVWEALLRNTRISIPEVARLAKLGTMPRPLLEIIVGNAAWLQIPQIRRALLTNPRLSAEMVQKVLSLLPRPELKLVPQASAYPAAVRMAAKAMLKS